MHILLCYSKTTALDLKMWIHMMAGEHQLEVREMSPINRPYGCCINRNSRVTIVSTSGFDEVGTSWFTYYLAKFGGLTI